MALKGILYKERIFDISYEILNKNKKCDIVFLHGWGSNKEIMKQAFGKTLQDFRHIYIDLPGFGNSSNSMSLCSMDYCNIIEKFLKLVKFDKNIIIGHSFGGKISTLLNPKLLVLLSSAGILTPKPVHIKVKIYIFKLLKKLGFERFYKVFATKDVKNMDKNMYETLKNVVNEDFFNNFNNFSNNALVFWGKDDKATPLSSGRKISNLIKSSKFYELEGDHFFFMKNSLFIAKQIKANKTCI